MGLALSYHIATTVVDCPLEHFSVRRVAEVPFGLGSFVDGVYGCLMCMRHMMWTRTERAF